MSEKVTRIMLSDFPIDMYFTNTISERLNFGFSSEEYLELRNAIEVFNFSLDNAFINSLNVEENNFFIEHTQKFAVEEFEELKIKVKNEYDKIHNQ